MVGYRQRTNFFITLFKLTMSSNKKQLKLAYLIDENSIYLACEQAMAMIKQLLNERINEKNEYGIFFTFM